MNKHITIEFPYDQVTLEFAPGVVSKPAYPMNSHDWKALVEAERIIYRMDGAANGWTDVHPNDGDRMLNSLWEQAEMSVDGEISLEDFADQPSHLAVVRARTAKRVAQALAILSFGSEILLK